MDGPHRERLRGDLNLRRTQGTAASRHWPAGELAVSGVFGVLSLDGARSWTDEARAMSRSLAHRGLAGAQLRFTHRAAVGVRHRSADPGDALAELASTPGIVAVLDGRIDNRAELAARLPGCAGASPTDAELVLRSYLLWGERCARQLIGDFAFAILDESRGCLLLGRDSMGVKPLYYHRSATCFAFASEIGALLALPEVPRTLDEAQLALQLVWGEPDRESTVYRAIQRVPAASTLIVHASGCQREPVRYWSLDDVAPLHRADPRDYAEEFREIFRTAVVDRLHGVAHAATALSGGLDSSSITCLARDHALASGDTRISAVSLIFEGLSGEDRRLIDERSFVQAVVADGGFEWLPIEGTQLSPLGELETLLSRIGQPFAAPNVYLHDAMYRRAAQAGATVFLDGVDGDTAVGHGFGRLNGLLARREWDGFAHQVRSFAARDGRGESRVLRHYGLPYLADLAEQGRWVEWARVSLALTQRFGISRRDVLGRWGVAPVVQRIRGHGHAGGSAKQRTDGVLLPSLLDGLRHMPRRPARQRAALEVESHRQGLLQPAYQQTLEIADACATGVGIEPRYPFFDRRLIEFCVALPEEQKLDNGWSRLILRRAMEGILPAAVQWRTGKSNLAPAFQQSFVETDRATVLAAEFQRLEGIAQLDQLEELRQDYRAGAMREWGNPASYLLFRAAVLAEWLKQGEVRSDTHPESAYDPGITQTVKAGAEDGRLRTAPAVAFMKRTAPAPVRGSHRRPITPNRRD